jgi:hypothetical protein
VAAISITFNTSAAQDARLAKVLAAVNGERAASNPPADPFATIEAYLHWVVIEAVKGYVARQAEAERAAVASAFDAADATTQAAVKAALGL